MGKDLHNVYIRLPRRFWLNGTSHAKKWISAAGGFLGILAVLWSSSSVLVTRERR